MTRAGRGKKRGERGGKEREGETEKKRGKRKRREGKEKGEREKKEKRGTKKIREGEKEREKTLAGPCQVPRKGVAVGILGKEKANLFI